MNQRGDFVHDLVDVYHIGFNLLKLLLSLHQELLLEVEVGLNQLLLLLRHVHVVIVAVVVDVDQKRFPHLHREELLRLKILLDNCVELRDNLLQHHLMGLLRRRELHDGVQLLDVNARGFDDIIGAFLNTLTAEQIKGKFMSKQFSCQ